MANYTALVDVKVDVGRANKAFKNIEGSLLRVSKATKSTNAFLSRMENTFTRMEKTFGKIHRAQSHQINQLKKMGSSAGDAASQIAELEGRVKKLEKSLKNTTDAAKKQIPFLKSLGKFYKQNAFLIQSMASAFIGFLQFNIVGGLRRMTDQFTLMTNRIKMVDDSTKAMNTNMRMTYRLAQETRVPLFQMGNTLARIGRVSRTLKADLGKLATVVSTVGKAFQIGGATIEEANNAMIQLSQAFASGRLQGDELRSVLELAPRLAEGISSAIGITVGSLRKFAKEGKLTTKVLELALLEASQNIDKEFSKIDQTIGQSLTKVSNAITQLAGSTSKSFRITERFAKSFDKIVRAIERLKGGAIVEAIAKFFGFLADNLAAVALVLAGGGLIFGLSALAAVVVAIAAAAPKATIAITGLVAAIGGLAYINRDVFKGFFEDIENLGKTVEERLKTSNDRLKELRMEGDMLSRVFGRVSTAGSTEELIKRSGGYMSAEESAFLRKSKTKYGDKATLEIGKQEIEFRLLKEIQKIDAKRQDLLKQRNALDQSNLKTNITKGDAQKEFLKQSVAELETLKAVNRERLKGVREINKARVAASKAAMDDPASQQRITGLAGFSTSLVKGINELLKESTGFAGADVGGLVDFKTGKIRRDRIAQMQATPDIQNKLVKTGKPGSEFIGVSGKAILDNQIEALILKTQNQVQILFENIKTTAEVAANVAIRTAQRLTAELGNRRQAEFQITGVMGTGNIQEQQLKIDAIRENLAGKLARNKAIQAGHDEASAKQIAAQAQAQQIITNQIRQQAIIRKNQQVSAGLKLGEAFGGVSGANQEAMMRGTGQLTSPGEFNPRVFGFGGGQDSARKNFFSETEGHNKRMLDIAKKMGISEEKLHKVKESNHGLDLEKLYFDEESLNLKGAYLDMFNNEVEASNQILKNQQKKNELDEAASAVPGDVKAAQGIGMLGSATGGPAGARASSISNAYAAGGGGLTGAINALVAMLMGNKKIMEAIEKVFAMVFDVLDLFMDPIGELLDAIGTVLKPVFNILRPIFQMFGKLFKILQGVLKPIGQIFEMLNMFIAPLMAVMQAILGFLNALVGGLMETIIQPLLDGLMRVGGLDPDGYKPQVLLEEEAKILDKIEGSLEGAADALKQINDVVFDITQSALNLAAPAIKAEDATEKYEELKRAAMRAGATEDAINEFTGYASTYLQVQQDILKSSGAYQTIYESVINDLQGLQRGISETVGDELTRTLKQATLDLDLVGSDLGHVIREVASQMEDGAITFSQFIDFVSFKARQVDQDLALYEILSTADLGEDVGYIQSVYGQTMGPAKSGYAGFNFGGGSNTQAIRNAVAADFKAMKVEALVVNPTHYAVGLTRNSDGSVSVSAVGEDAMALEMIAAANVNGVPVIRDPETARALATGSGSTSGLSFSGGSAVISGVNALAPSIGDLGSGVSASTGGGSSSMFSLPDMDIGKLFSALVQGIIDGIANAFQQIGNLAGELMDAVFGWINQIGVGVHDFMNAIFQPIFGLIGQLNVTDFIFGIFQPIIALGSVNVADWLLGIFSPLRGLVVNGAEFIGKILDPIIGALGGIGNVMGDVLNADIFGMGSLSDGINTYTNYVQDLFGETVGFIEDIFKLDFGSAGARIGEAFTNMGKLVEDIFGSVGIDFDLGFIGKQLEQSLKDLFSGNIFAGFTGLGGILQDAVAEIFKLAGLGGDEIKLLPNPFSAVGIGPSHFIKFKLAGGGSLEGLAKGPSHARGGIPGVVGGRTPIEFEGGEYIMSKKAVDNIGVGAMNMINEAGKRYAQGGGVDPNAHTYKGLTTKGDGDGSKLFNLSARVGGTVGSVLNRIGFPDGLFIRGGVAGVEAGLHGGSIGGFSSAKIGNPDKASYAEGGITDMGIGKPLQFYRDAGISGTMGFFGGMIPSPRLGGRAMNIGQFTNYIKWDQGPMVDNPGQYMSPALHDIWHSGSPMSAPLGAQRGVAKWSKQKMEWYNSLTEQERRSIRIGTPGSGLYGYGIGAKTYEDAQNNPFFATSPQDYGGYRFFQRALFDSSDPGISASSIRNDVNYKEGDIYNRGFPALSLPLEDFIEYTEISAGQPLGATSGKARTFLADTYNSQGSSLGYMEYMDKQNEGKKLRARYFDYFMQASVNPKLNSRGVGGMSHKPDDAQHPFSYLDLMLQSYGANNPFWQTPENFEQSEQKAMQPFYQYAGIPPMRGGAAGAGGGGYEDFLDMLNMDITGQGQYTGDNQARKSLNLVQNPGTTTNEILAVDVNKLNVVRSVADALGLTRVVDTVVEVLENVPIFGLLGETIGSFVKKIYETVTTAIVPKITAKIGLGINPPKGIFEGGLSYGRGGLIHGPDHAHGGKAIYAEGGEYIVNKNATKKHLGLLHRINYQEGGTTYNPGSSFARQDIDFTNAGAYFSNVQESVRNLTQGSVGDITNLYSREVELNAELTTLFTELASSVIDEIQGLKQNLITIIQEVLTNITVKTSTDGADTITGEIRSYIADLAGYVIGQMMTNTFKLGNGFTSMLSHVTNNSILPTIQLVGSQVVESVGNFISSMTFSHLTGRVFIGARDNLVQGGRMEGTFTNWTDFYTGEPLPPPNFEGGGLVDVLKYAAGGETINQGPSIFRKTERPEGDNLLRAVYNSNDDLFKVGQFLHGSIVEAQDAINFARGSINSPDHSDSVYRATKRVESNQGRFFPDIKETVDHMRKKMDSGGAGTGIFGNAGTVIDKVVGGTIGAIGGAVSNIFSDRGLKSFRAGGMTESQQTDLLRKVQPHTYRYKSGGPVQTGFMAQDLERSSFGRQFVHDSPAGKYVDGGIIGPLLASQSIMQSRMDSYQGGGVVASSGISEQLLQGIIDAIRDQDMNVNVYTNTEDEVGQMLGSQSASQGEANYRGVSDYA